MILQKNKAYLGLIITIIIAFGIFLRSYHFSDWLHFELDQSRDAKVVALAAEQGIGNLPLLGPKAAGSFLRLGPIFYYFEYLGAKIFGNTPVGMAVPNLLFSILTLPLFYFFVRRYFDQKISAALLSLFSVSLFMIMYSRFAWNPNNLPFFIMLSFYSLLRTVDDHEKRKGWWLIASSAAIALATQLHFVAFLAIPAIAVAFLLLKRPRIKLLFWIASILIFIFFYIPPIINDFKTGGDNIKEFKKIFIKKSSRNENTLIEKAIRSYTENAIGYFLVTTSNQNSELPKFSQAGIIPDTSCDKKCRDNLPEGILALLFFTTGIALLAFNAFRARDEQANPKKDFLILTALWFGLSMMLFTPLAYDLAPRFFLLIAGLPFIFLGFILNFLENIITKKNVFYFVFAILILLVAISNLVSVKNRFSEMNRAPFQDFKINSDKILKENNRVTLEQQLRIADYMQEIFVENRYPVYVNSEAFYRRALLYNLEERGVTSDDFRNSQLAEKVYRHGNYFLVYPANSNLRSRTEKYLGNYDLAEQKNFGTLVVIRLVPKEEAINALEQEFQPSMKARSASGVPVRCRWNEIFRECNPDEPEDSLGNLVD